jgi:PqqD family protein of HPr-rel-A system
VGASTEIAPRSVLRRARQVIFNQLDDELLAIDMESGYCYSLNQSAGRLWELIEEPATMAAVCEQLRAEYDIDLQTCLNDVRDVLLSLRAAGLIEVENASST